MAQLTVQQSNYSNILQAIFTIATTGPVTFQKTTFGEVPTPQQISDAQAAVTTGSIFPWFAVRQGVFRRYADLSGTSQGGDPDAGMRVFQTINPIWDFDCYTFLNYDEQNNNYGAAATIMSQLCQLFMQSMNLNNTCATSTLHSPGIILIDYNNRPYTVTKFTVGAYEILGQDYA